MKNRIIFIIVSLLFAFCVAINSKCSNSQGWISLFNGESLDGWRASENPNSISVVDGQIVCNGPRSHLFYIGDVQNANFKNFELKADVMTEPGSNSGIYFHTEYQEKGWPNKGYEVQIDNTHKGSGSYREFKRTGSLYGVRNLFKQIVSDNEWFNIHFIVKGKRIITKVNGTLIVDYTEPDNPVRNDEMKGRLLSSGTIALQCHDPDSKVFFKNIIVKPLPDDISDEPVEMPIIDERYAEIVLLNLRNFPIIDFHVHVKGGLTLEEALTQSRRNGINYGIAPNCGIGFPITDDEGIYKFLKSMENVPVFIGMQAEGREWVNLFSKEAIAKFDYVFTDALTFTDDNGKRTRLWMRNEVNIKDKQAFMDMYVDRTLSVLNNEPIDIFVNPTFLPGIIADKYDELWTEERMQKVINAAVKNDIAIEINDRYKIPSATFIKLAKKSGAKFSFGTNNAGNDLGRLEYCLEMLKECGLTSNDMFMPKPDGMKKVQMTGF